MGIVSNERFERLTHTERGDGHDDRAESHRRDRRPAGQAHGRPVLPAAVHRAGSASSISSAPLKQI